MPESPHGPQSPDPRLQGNPAPDGRSIRYATLSPAGRSSLRASTCRRFSTATRLRSALGDIPTRRCRRTGMSWDRRRSSSRSSTRSRLRTSRATSRWTIYWRWRRCGSRSSRRPRIWGTTRSRSPPDDQTDRRREHGQREGPRPEARRAMPQRGVAAGLPSLFLISSRSLSGENVLSLSPSL